MVAKKQMESRFSYKKLICVIIICYLMGVAFRALELPSWNKPYLSIDGEKLLATHDAYLWVATAKGTSRIIDASLPEIARFLHKVTNIKIGNLAFWLPLVLSPLVCLPVCVLAMVMGIEEAGLIAGTFSVVSLGYLLRTRVGFFDTDIGSLFFLASFACLLITWLVSRFPISWARKDKVPIRSHGTGELEYNCTQKDILWALFIGVVGATYKWFHPGAQKMTFVFLVLAFGVYLYLCYPYIKLKFVSCFLMIYALAYGGWIGAIASGILAISLWNPGEILKERYFTFIFFVFFLLIMYYSNFFHIVQAIYEKAFYWLKPSSVEVVPNSTGILLPSISQSIREAQNLSWDPLVMRCAGNWIVFWAGVVGILYLIFRCPFALLMIPFFVLGIASHKMGNRFSMYAGVGWGIGVGFGLIFFLKNRVRPGLRWVIASVVTILLLISPFMTARHLKATPILPKIYARTFLDLHKITPKNARLWQWWDYGYTAQYYGGRMSFCDGGLNYGDWVYPLAVVHTTSSPMEAAQLIKYITLHQQMLFKKEGARALDPSWYLTRTLPLKKREEPRRKYNLKKMVPGWYPPYYIADPLAGIRDLSPGRAQKLILSMRVKRFKFPSSLPPQYFVVSWENLRLAYWISYFGKWDIVTGTTDPGKILNVRGRVEIDLKRGGVLTQGKMIPIQSLDVVSSGKRRHVEWDNHSHLHLIYNPISRDMFLMDDTIYNSMMVQLLIGDPENFTPYFKLVVDHYPWARAYRVE